MHLGNNVKRLREILGFTQDYVAVKLDLLQQTYSNLEKSEIIPKDKLELISKVFNISIEAIENFREDMLFNNINNSHGCNNINYQFQSIDKIVELYERLLKEKDEVISLYKSKLKN
jgi:transcriptional regulator with XRE-family HTH domain